MMKPVIGLDPVELPSTLFTGVSLTCDVVGWSLILRV